MTMDTFSNKDNMNMLWEIISSEDIFKFLTGENKSKIFKLFVENAKGFFESEKMKTHNLLDLNKKYILIILNYIQTNYPYHKIKIYPDSEKVKELITELFIKKITKIIGIVDKIIVVLSNVESFISFQLDGKI